MLCRLARYRPRLLSPRLLLVLFVIAHLVLYDGRLVRVLVQSQREGCLESIG